MAIKNEEDILRIINSLENEWCNPFDVQNVPNQLINICTGKIADSETGKSLSNFFETAQEHVKTLLNSLQQSFWNPVKRNKIATFKNDISKKKVLSNRISLVQNACSVELFVQHDFKKWILQVYYRMSLLWFQLRYFTRTVL